VGLQIRHQKPHNHLAVDSAQLQSHVILKLELGENILLKTQDLNVVEPLLTEALALDQCLLLSSAAIAQHLLLKMECLEEDDAYSSESPLLEHTMAFLQQYYGQGIEIQVERNGHYRRPHFYSGSETNIDMLLQMQMGLREWTPQYRSLQNDTLFVQQLPPWHLDRISQRFGALDQLYQYKNTAPSVDIYLMDTGIEAGHPEFEGRATFLGNTVGDSIPTDCNGHGTHCAGLCGAHTYGVAKQSQLFGVKVLDCSGNGDSFTILAGVMMILEHHATRPGRRGVINLSLGGEISELIDNAVLSLNNQNMPTFVAAGNNGADACLFSPAHLALNGRVVSVGATTQSDTRASFSNYGACTSFYAPGYGITSTWKGLSTRTISGTSMATPQVTGAAALVLQEDPSLSVSEVYSLLLNYATPDIVHQAAGGNDALLYTLVDASNTNYHTTTPSAPTLVNGGSSSASAMSCSCRVLLLFLLPLFYWC
jgi:subtilisin family serine protease